jgi:hypothetical protein
MAKVFRREWRETHDAQSKEFSQKNRLEVPRHTYDGDEASCETNLR